MLVRKSAVALAATYIAGIALAMVGPTIMPANYYFDTATIRESMQTAQNLAINDSFNNTALVYRWLGFGTMLPDALAGPISYTAVFLAIIASAGLVRARWHPLLFALFAAWNVPLAIYDGTHSKEAVALLVVAAMAGLSRSAAGVALAACVGLLYAVLFRNYWGPVLVLWLAMLAAWRSGGGWAARLIVAVLTILPLSLAAYQYSGMWLSDGRTVVVDAREFDPDSATIFANLLPNTSAVTDLVNTAAGWAMLMAPVFLLLLGGAQHVAFAGFQFANTALFVVSQWRARDVARSNSAVAWRFASATTFCIAYTLVQGMFEPDFGSFAKHEVNLLPMLFFVLLHSPRARGSTESGTRAFAKERG
jgi:hypothetical protein